MEPAAPELTPARAFWARARALQRAAFPWDSTVLLAVAAVIGLYGGIAAGLFAACIRTAQLLLFRWHDVAEAVVEPASPWRRQLAERLAKAPWHLEFAIAAALLVALSLLLSWLAENRKVRVPVFEAHRLRAAGVAGAFGLALFYPLLLLRTFNGSFHESEGGLFEMLTAAPWWLRLLAPAVGGLFAGLLVRHVSPESGGHGVVEVIEAVHARGDKLRGRVALWKSVAAGLVIGSGGSAGREGPVVHVGGSVAAGLAKMLGLPRDASALLIACGAAAGISASFHAPLAGTMFALEIVLGDFGARRFTPVVLASVTATVTARALLGGGADLRPVAWQMQSGGELGLYLILGIISGVFAILYIRSNGAMEHFFEERLARLKLEWRLALGGLCVGLAGLAVPRILGTGIESMNAALAGQLTLAALAAALFAKLLATALTLGSGAPGGSFFPAVFVGAMLGGAFGQLVRLALPGLTAGPEAYAAVGMGAVVAGATVAPLTGVLMLFELTGSYQIVLPLLVACGIAAALVQRALGGSMYALKARLRGVHFEKAAPLRDLSVAEAVERVEPVPAGEPWVSLVRRVSETSHAAFPVVDGGGRLVGLLSVREVRAALLDPALEGLAVARDLARSAPALLLDDSLERALEELRRTGASEAAVLEPQASGPERPVGVVTREGLLAAWAKASEAS